MTWTLLHAKSIMLMSFTLGDTVHNWLQCIGYIYSRFFSHIDLNISSYKQFLEINF